ncbi:hypothetical protein [Terrihabitans sp. B22-R8]|uniref:hypothetical protein n=1 Tax=Terrihabitans sp. B22-R8 TaxID=3425128 RepID=UPI00403CC354
MIVASNTPDSFYPKNGYVFLSLGERIDAVDVVVLMLEKNWGSFHIDRIKAVTHWISKYPKHIPCYIAGCESTIPSMELERYRHKERDEAVRALCDEVLKRSKSIGVRGNITFHYLTSALGYSEDKVDVMYHPGINKNNDNLLLFLEKNGCPSRLEKDILSFQRKPHVFYEKPINYDKNITISLPYVTATDDKVSLNADVKIDGESKTLWCETSAAYRQFLLFERSDAFLCALLPLAMRTGKDIVCDAPVTEEFLHNINEILIPQLCAHDSRLHRTFIKAASAHTKLFCGNAVSTGMSCGVDSFYTTMLYSSSSYVSMGLTHLYCGNYLYGNDGPIYERAQAVADELELPLIKTSTNANEILCLPHVFTHFFKTMFGVLSLRKLFRVYYYSTTEDFSHFNLKDNSIRDTAIIELLLLYVFCCSDFQLVSGGVKAERLEKTRAISAFPPAQKLLNVCLYPEREKNCGKCGKCMRTLLMLDMLGSLQLFDDVFDIKEYIKNRLESFTYLIGEKRSIMLSEVYRHFLQAEPKLIAEAEKLFASPTKSK